MKNLIKCFQISCVFFLSVVGMVTIAMDRVDGKQVVAAKRTIEQHNLNSRGSSTDTSSADALEVCNNDDVWDLIKYFTTESNFKEKVNFNFNCTFNNNTYSKDEKIQADITNLKQELLLTQKQVIENEEIAKCLQQQLLFSETKQKNSDKKISIHDKVLKNTNPGNYSKAMNEYLYRNLGLYCPKNKWHNPNSNIQN